MNRRGSHGEPQSFRGIGRGELPRSSQPRPGGVATFSIGLFILRITLPPHKRTIRIPISP